MVKKVTAVLLSVLLVICLSGCSGVSREEYDKVVDERDELEAEIEDLEDEIEELEAQLNDLQAAGAMLDQETAGNDDSDDTGSQRNEFDEDSVIAQLDITEYQWFTDYYNNAALVVKNNSDFTLSASINMVFYDAEGNMIGAADDYKYAFEAGDETAFVFGTEEKFASFDYEISVVEEQYYDGLVSDISHEVSLTPEKAVIAVTNNGSKAADYVGYVILFFNGTEVVDSNWGYCGDAEGKLKPGKTEYSENNCYVTFDAVEVYFTAYTFK